MGTKTFKLQKSTKKVIVFVPYDLCDKISRPVLWTISNNWLKRNDSKESLELDFKSFKKQPQHNFHSDSHTKLSYDFRRLGVSPLHYISHGPLSRFIFWSFESPYSLAHCSKSKMLMQFIWISVNTVIWTLMCIKQVG